MFLHLIIPEPRINPSYETLQHFDFDSREMSTHPDVRNIHRCEVVEEFSLYPRHHLQTSILKVEFKHSELISPHMRHFEFFIKMNNINNRQLRLRYIIQKHLYLARAC